MSHLKGIAFESSETQLAKLRQRLHKMSDGELIAFGKLVHGLSVPRVSVMPDPCTHLAEGGGSGCANHGLLIT